jgi:phosphate transport system permease protein
MSTEESPTTDNFLPDFNTVAAKKYRKWRDIKDVMTRYLMAFGGVSVILAIVLIAFYLFYVVVPMFRPAHIEGIASFSAPGDAQAETLLYAMEEQREVGLRVTTNNQLDAKAVFFDAKNGQVRESFDLPLPSGAEVSSVSAGDPSTRTMALGLSNGNALLFQHEYKVSYPNDVCLITPFIHYPLGEDPIQIDALGQGIRQITVQSLEEQSTFVALMEDMRVMMVHVLAEESMLSDEVELTRTDSIIPVHSAGIEFIKLDIEARELYIADDKGFIYYFDVSDKSEPRLVQKVRAVAEGVKITSLEFLSGGISILVGDSSGRISQWFPVRDKEKNYTLELIRSFEEQEHPITAIASEYFRKGFAAVDDHGGIGLYHTTAHRTVKLQEIGKQPLQFLAMAPRANAVLVENDQNQLEYLHVDNEHPEISWQSLWGKVWYESRDKPEYIWQSSSASSDFEPKFSLTPLAFGTFKAAFYAMLFAVPLAIFGAMYTAYFMSPRMRSYVKPTIEIMEALPTVILGFLAGLWLAPFVETHLPGIFALIFCIPISILIVAALWGQLPSELRHKVPDGFEAALLIPVIILTTIFSIAISAPIENLFFGGNMPLWLNTEMGIGFDQRNSLVVGLAMGFAVIPTIFSISEDAVYSVPKHLTIGSLALGATPWQTMVRVILLTASPGIFSAIMIGLGRAVGETMIVVMATGNTAIMDMNIFEGFRALSANIAVEMPEAEVESSHYRILFLAALVLFMATFVFNTIAEVVRQRLRVKYSSL